MTGPLQRLDALSNAHAGSAFELVVRDFFETQGIHLNLKYLLDVGIAGIHKKHAFDLGSAEPRVIVECKFHRWRTGGNIPSAKLRVWNEAMLYFLAAPLDYRKILCVLRDRSELRGSLAEYYVRIYRHLIPDGVEIWEFDEVTRSARKIYPA